MSKEKNKGGAPSTFSQEIADRICDEIATTSKSLKTICKEEGMPSVRTVLNWLNEGDNPDGKEHFKRFLRQYARAKEDQADFLAEEIIEISDDSSQDTKRIYKDGKEIEIEDKEWTNRSRLRVDARKWIAAHLKPKKYGDRIDHNIEGEQTIIVKFEE